MQRLRQHAAPVGQEEKHCRVELERRAGHDSAVWDAFLNPALRYPVCQETHDR